MQRAVSDDASHLGDNTHSIWEMRYTCTSMTFSAPALYTCTVRFTVRILSFQTNWSGQIVQTQIRLLLEEQSDQGLHCLLFHLHLFDEIPKALASFLEF